MYFKKIWHAFKESFKFKLSFVFVVLYEVLFFLIVMGFIYLFIDVLYRIALSMQNFSALQAEELSVVMQSFLTKSIVTTVGFFLLICAAYAIIQSLAWAQVVDKKLSVKFVARFFGAQLLWALPWALLYWFFIVGLTQSFAIYGIVILSLIFVYLTFLFQHSLMHKGIKESMGAAFSVGFGKMHLLFLPMFIALATAFIWMKVIEVITNILAFTGVQAALSLTNATAFTAIVLSCIVLAPLLAWFKFYMHKVLAIL